MVLLVSNIFRSYRIKKYVSVEIFTFPCKRELHNFSRVYWSSDSLLFPLNWGNKDCLRNEMMTPDFVLTPYKRINLTLFTITCTYTETYETQAHVKSFIHRDTPFLLFLFFSHKFSLRANYYKREYITPNTRKFGD